MSHMYLIASSCSPPYRTGARPTLDAWPRPVIVGPRRSRRRHANDGHSASRSPGAALNPLQRMASCAI